MAVCRAQHLGTLSPAGAAAVKIEPDRPFESYREQVLIVAVPTRRSWPPENLPSEHTTSHEHWLTRGARGISWHRAGRASQGRLQ